MPSRGVVAPVHGLVEALRKIGGVRGRMRETRVTEIRELADIPLATERAFDAHGRSVQIRLRSLPLLIEHLAGREPVEAEGARHFVRLIAREQVSEAVPG